MFLELVFITLSYSVCSLFFEWGVYNSKFGTRSFVILYLAKLCKSAKLELGAETGLIYWRCKSVIGLNVVVFIRVEVGNIQANLFVVGSTINIKVTEDLLCFICDDGREDKIPSEVIDHSRGKFSWLFFSEVLVCNLLLKLLWQYCWN